MIGGTIQCSLCMTSTSEFGRSWRYKAAALYRDDEWGYSDPDIEISAIILSSTCICLSHFIEVMNKCVSVFWLYVFVMTQKCTADSMFDKIVRISSCRIYLPYNVIAQEDHCQHHSLVELMHQCYQYGRQSRLGSIPKMSPHNI